MIGSSIEAVSATLSGAVLGAIPGLYGIFSGMIKIEEEKLDLELWHKITHLA